MSKRKANGRNRRYTRTVFPRIGFGFKSSSGLQRGALCFESYPHEIQRHDGAITHCRNNYNPCDYNVGRKRIERARGRIDDALRVARMRYFETLQVSAPDDHANRDTFANCDRNANCNRYANCDRDCYGDQDCHTDCDGHANRDRDANCDRDRYGDQDCHTDIVTHSERDANANVDAQYNRLCRQQQRRCDRHDCIRHLRAADRYVKW
jgi:hypothetical protein